MSSLRTGTISVGQGNLDSNILPDMLLYLFVDEQAFVLCHTKCQMEIRSNIIKKKKKDHYSVYREKNSLGIGFCLFVFTFHPVVIFFLFNSSIISKIMGSGAPR